ncbi:MAG TPA: addiction module antidote protein, HigA family [Desulfobacteraceae bacterium]|nr:addiction module antidote protein, HigA family [Desulfobacteraceae bacterium]
MAALLTLAISINQLSRDFAVPPNRISEIVNGKRSLTADTALRLEQYFGIEARFWLNLQSEYDLRGMRRKSGHDIRQRILPARRPSGHGGRHRRMSCVQHFTPERNGGRQPGSSESRRDRFDREGCVPIAGGRADT